MSMPVTVRYAQLQYLLNMQVVENSSVLNKNSSVNFCPSVS